MAQNQFKCSMIGFHLFICTNWNSSDGDRASSARFQEFIRKSFVNWSEWRREQKKKKQMISHFVPLISFLFQFDLCFENDNDKHFLSCSLCPLNFFERVYHCQLVCCMCKGGIHSAHTVTENAIAKNVEQAHPVWTTILLKKKKIETKGDVHKSKIGAI